MLGDALGYSDDPGGGKKAKAPSFCLSSDKAMNNRNYSGREGCNHLIL